MGLIMMQSLECGVDGIRKFLVLAFVMIVIVTTELRWTSVQGGRPAGSRVGRCTGTTLLAEA